MNSEKIPSRVEAPYTHKERLYLSPFQTVKQDMSFILGKDVPYSDLAIAAFDSSEYIMEMVLKDIQMLSCDEKKSYCIGFDLQAHDRTLTREDINDIRDKIVDSVFNKTGAVLRTSEHKIQGDAS